MGRRKSKRKLFKGEPFETIGRLESFLLEEGTKNVIVFFKDRHMPVKFLVNMRYSTIRRAILMGAVKKCEMKEVNSKPQWLQNL